MPIVAVVLALTINSVTPTVINSSDDTVIVNASYSGTTTATQYLQAVFNKEGQSPARYFGLTRNLDNAWYQYKSSPTLTDLSGYFYRFTPISASWSGQLTAKVDINSDNYKGPGNYLLKLFRHVTAGGIESDNNAVVTINISLAEPVEDTSDEIPKPSVSWSTADKAILGEALKLNIELSSFEPSKDFFIKVRGGLNESQLTKAQTQNGSAFLSDNESWSGFPKITTDSSGNWKGEISAQFSEDQAEGSYKLKIRVKKKDSDTFYESETKEVSFTRSSALFPLPPLPRATVSASSPSSTRDQYNLVLGTGSSSLASLPTPTKGENVGATRQRDWFSLGLIFSGLAISLGAMVLFFYKEEIWRRFYGIIKRDEA